MEQGTVGQELASIRALMAESQELLYGTWPHQMVWGVLVAGGLVATWAGVQTGAFSLIGWMWGGLLAVGWGYSLARARRPHAKERVRNVATRAFGGIWSALGVTLTLMGSMAVFFDALDPESLPGLVALVFGGGYFASGFLSELRWLTLVGCAWWVGGVGLLLWHGPGALVALALMALVLEVGPAMVLRRMERTRDAGR